METNKHGLELLILCALLFCSGGCRESQEEWKPPLEQTSTLFLQNQVVDAMRCVREAQTHLPTEPDRAMRILDGAISSLAQMSDYYLPLLEAREHAYNAHRFLFQNNAFRARTEMESIEKILDQVAKKGGTALTSKMKRALDLVSEAKAAVMATSEEAPDLIRSLAVRLDSMALKGGLELSDQWTPHETGDDQEITPLQSLAEGDPQ